MTREELLAIIRAHHGNGTWCDGCNARVGNLNEHLADMIMPRGVDYLLEGRVLDEPREAAP